ncbi:hypothetical protein PAMP_022893 [Pampus punctatissimus]
MAVKEGSVVRVGHVNERAFITIRTVMDICATVPPHGRKNPLQGLQRRGKEKNKNIID